MRAYVVSCETQCYWAQMDNNAKAIVVLLLLGTFLRESYAVSYREPLQCLRASEFLNFTALHLK